jgi:ThiF family
MSRRAKLQIPEPLWDELHAHLFPGDGDEHGAVLTAGYSRSADGDVRLTARSVTPANEERDYLVGQYGHRALQASFIHRHVTRCRDQKLVYLAVHNHGGHGSVSFSSVDLESHERGYPALLDIVEGMPVGALVVAEGALELDLWIPGGERTSLRQANVIGNRYTRLYSNGRIQREVEHSPTGRAGDAWYDRQELIFGDRGQALMRGARVTVIGLGGVGAIVSEQLARLGVGQMTLIDPDHLEPSNFSRIVGATTADLTIGARKVDIAARVARDSNPNIDLELIAGDFAIEPVARRAIDSDFLFLAADTMRARLVFNALVHQYYVPGVQIGSKIAVNPRTGSIDAAFSVVRHVRPGTGCLVCNELIDPVKLAEEWKTDVERAAQRYGITLANPSVITLNAVAASHAVNDFFLWFLGLAPKGLPLPYRRIDYLTGRSSFAGPRKDRDCLECSTHGRSRFGMGDAIGLPCAAADAGIMQSA